LHAAIAGIDSGATSAYAIVSLSGEVVEVSSAKGSGGRFLSDSLSRFVPLSFVACDTRPPSKEALRLKRAFSCMIFFPRKSMPAIEKERLCAGHRIANTHERDALAAALKCHAGISSKLRQVRRRARGAVEADEGRLEELARKVLSGRRLSDEIKERG